MIIWPAKDPGEVLDFTWKVPLDTGDAIVSHTASIASGSATIDSDSHSDDAVTVVVSAGVADTSIFVSLSAVTTNGRTFKETGVIPIIDRADAVLASFRMRFPAFASVSDGQIAYWVAVGGTATASWSEADQSTGRLLYAAHNLASQGLGTGAIPAGVTSFKSGTFSATVSDGLASKTGFAATSYGRDYLALARRNFAGPRLAWTPPAHV